MMKNYKLAGALCANALIVLFEVIALILSLKDQGLENFLFYTQDSNYLAMAASLLFCIYALKKLRGKGDIPKWVYSFRYITVSCLMVTFFVVLFVLMPMMDENPFFMLYGGSMLYQHTLCPVLSAFSFFVFEIMDENPFFMLYGGSMLYQHTLCPVLSAFSFFVFEITDKLPHKEILKALIPTLSYALISFILNICKITEGPYFFLMVYAQPWYTSLIWCIIILGIAGFLASVVRMIHNFIYKRKMN